MPKFEVPTMLKSTIPGIPKPEFRSSLPKGTIIKLTPEQEKLLRRAGFTRSMIFVVGSPIKDPPLEHPRQETPYHKVKNMRSVRSVRTAGNTRTHTARRNLMKEFEAVSK